jgi:hypothetical protein
LSFTRTRFEGRCQLAHHQIVRSEVVRMGDSIAAKPKPRNWICLARTSYIQLGAGAVFVLPIRGALVGVLAPGQK